MPKRKPSAHFAKQAQEAYELSLAGYSYRQIAEKMGVSLGTVQRRLDLYIKERVHPKADEYRARQIDRAQIYIRSLWSQVLAGDPKSIAQAIRTEERIAKLLGLDSATAFKVEIEKTDDALEFNKMLDQILGTVGRTEREGNRPRPIRPPKARPAITYTAAPDAEFRNDTTFQPREVQPEAFDLGDEADFEPEPAPRPRRQSKPSSPLLVDDDD
ncbi:hypothetical protein GCM10010385_58240 [Streptomyces geysiriensis]|uniref:sigma factor-like helix-turn-helix DNA-binding protein n=1 Tax=Streptomyces rochei TaxID=1928 RepID=UPI00178644F8|nr:hypothetical protein GCM10010385_58240 [Streptomyces geysiriensis]